MLHLGKYAAGVVYRGIIFHNNKALNIGGS